MIVTLMHEIKIENQHCRFEVNKTWNGPSPEEVGALKTSLFKAKYDKRNCKNQRNGDNN